MAEPTDAVDGPGERPLVSVIVPTYQRRERVLAALREVEAQTWRPIEAVVVDDCSTDGTADAVRARRSGIPVRVVELERNGGPGRARNVGIDHARGRYVAFLDSDDRWHPEKLSTQMALFERDARPDRLVAYSRVVIERDSDTVVRPERPIADGEPVGDYLFVDAGVLHTSTLVMPTALAARVRFVDAMRLHEDWDLLMRLQRAGARFAMAEAPLATWDDRSAPGRSSAPRPERSFAWLEAQRGVLSTAAYLALRAKIAPQLRASRPVAGLGYVWSAWARGAIGLDYLLALHLDFVHPGSRRLLRAALHRIGRGRNGGASGPSAE
ncbi:MAG TPA: glycosyltransferase family 2 protein [Burkholderiaceae bacterium]|nr:glycosyltransferase family 2 protein [Burkholderiaceae bacterium]